MEAAQFLVIISRYASESMVTLCHMTKRNAAQIFRAHLVIYCLLTVFYSPLRHTDTCRARETEGESKRDTRTDTQYIYRCRGSLIRGHTFCIQPIRNAIRNSPQKPETLRSDGAKFSVECYWRCWKRFAVMTFHLLSGLHNALLGHHLMAKDNVSKSTNRKILLLTMQKSYKSKFSYTQVIIFARVNDISLEILECNIILFFFCLYVYVGHLLKHQTGEFFFETF